MFKRKSLANIDYLNKAGYVIYQNKKIAVVTQYNYSGKQNYLKEIGQCLWMFVYGIISIIGFPFCLFYTLFSFIPEIYIKDKSIDIKKQEEEDKADTELNEKINRLN